MGLFPTAASWCVKHEFSGLAKNDRERKIVREVRERISSKINLEREWRSVLKGFFPLSPSLPFLRKTVRYKNKREKSLPQKRPIVFSSPLQRCVVAVLRAFYGWTLALSLTSRAVCSLDFLPQKFHFPFLGHSGWERKKIVLCLHKASVGWQFLRKFTFLETARENMGNDRN